MTREPAWGPILSAAVAGDLPLVRVGQSAATVAVAFAGRQPVYLATPYSRVVLDEAGQWDYHLSSRAQFCAGSYLIGLMCEGVMAISPVVQTSFVLHGRYAFGGGPQGKDWHHGLDPLDEELWAIAHQKFLNVCGAVVVPDMEGWDRSRGIWAVMQFAVRHNLPVFVYGGGA